jgi:hypothetical protein
MLLGGRQWPQIDGFADWPHVMVIELEQKEILIQFDCRSSRK